MAVCKGQGACFLIEKFSFEQIGEEKRKDEAKIENQNKLHKKLLLIIIIIIIYSEATISHQRLHESNLEK